MDERLQHMEQALLKPHNLAPGLVRGFRACAAWLGSIPGRPPRLPTIATGPRDLTFEAGNVQDLEALADVELFSEWPREMSPLKLRLLADSPPGDRRNPLRSLLEQAYKADVLQALARGDRRHPELT